MSLNKYKSILLTVCYDVSYRKLMQYTLKKLKVCMSHFMHKTIRGENISRMKEFSFQFVKHSLRYCGEHAEDTSEGSEIYCNFEISKH